MPQQLKALCAGATACSANEPKSQRVTNRRSFDAGEGLTARAYSPEEANRNRRVDCCARIDDYAVDGDCELTVARGRDSAGTRRSHGQGDCSDEESTSHARGEQSKFRHGEIRARS